MLYVSSIHGVHLFFSVMGISGCMPVAPPRGRAQSQCGTFIKHEVYCTFHEIAR